MFLFLEYDDQLSKADLNGIWLTIKSADAKAHRTREVQLNPILKGIVTEIQHFQSQPIKFFSSSSSFDYCINYLNQSTNNLKPDLTGSKISSSS